MVDATFEEIQRIVTEDDKERFSLTFDTTRKQYKVRANHGHGIPGVVVTERRLTTRSEHGR